MTCYELWSIWGQWISGVGMIIVSIVLGIITFKISNTQVNLTKQSLKLGLYNQRYDVYRKLEGIIREIISSDDKIRTEALYDLASIRDDVVFLFDKEVHDYLVEIINKFEELNRYNYDLQRDDYYFELLGWFRNQYADEKQLRSVFKRYLDLSSYGLNKD